MATDKLGIDGLLQELTNRVIDGKNVTDADLDHLLSGGSLGTMPSEVSGEPEAEPTDEELLRAALDDEIASELNDAPADGSGAEAAGEGETGKSAEAETEAPSGEESGEEESDEDFDEDEEADSEDGESGENFDKFFE